jgi:Zn finger protein HypA/HybF involved in hydrogenase expression
MEITPIPNEEWRHYPILFAELDLVLNLNHSMNGESVHVVELKPGTSKKLDWKCSICNHKWIAKGSGRKKGNGCPACSNREIHIDGRNSMAVTHSELAKEYLGDASKIIAGTHKKLDWKCSICEHEWSAPGSQRSSSRGHGCPACDGKVLHFEGRNSMAVTHPELAKEYRGDARLVKAGTKKKLDWKCSKCEHEWSAVGTSRISGRGCPACSGNVIHSDGRNSMAVTHPELAKEYQGNARLVKAGTKKRLDWKCSKCEHEWKAIGKPRVKGVGCPACSGRVVHSDGRNSMAVTHPELAKEYQGDARLVKAGTGRKLDWKCSKCENEWKATGSSRRSGTGCPSCPKLITRKSRNSMAVNFPELAKEFQGDASKVFGHTKKKLNWKCSKCDNEWKATGSSRCSGTGCPACAGMAIHSDGRNSMAVTHPELAKEFQGDATKVFANTSSNHNWKCSKCEHKWITAGGNRVLLDHGCPSCASQQVHSDGRNSMAITNPELATEYQGDATKIFAGTRKKLNWKCSKCDNEWIATGAHRNNGTGCPSCANQQIHSDGRNTMAVTHPELAMEFQGDATKIFAGTTEKLDWKCSTCEHEWINTGRGRLMGRGCPACLNNEVHYDGRNSMAVTHPELAKEFQGDASRVIAGTNKKLDWKCLTCEHEWKVSGGSRTSGTGCPACRNKEIHTDGRNSMAITHPELAKEFQGNADQIIASTLNKLNWKCSICEYEWKATGHHRSNREQGCPACAITGFQPHLPAYYYVNEILNQFGDRLYYKGGISNDYDSRLKKLSQGLPVGMVIRNVEFVYFEIGEDARELEIILLKIDSIRAPKRDFDGGSELFLDNPLTYARVAGIFP